MKNSKSLFFLTLFFLLCHAFAKAQSPLETYIQIGLENNQQFLKTRLETKISNEEKEISKSFFLPDVAFDATYLLADGGRTIDFPIGDLFNPAYAALNNLTGTNQFPTDLANVNEQFLPNNFHETKIQVLQPIFNTNIYYGYKASKAKISVSQAKEDSYKNQLIFEISKAYYNHLQVLAQKRILDSTRLVVKELVRVNAKFVKYDVATKDALFNAQAQLDAVDAQMATVEKNINTSRIFFNYLLNRDLNEPILEETESFNGISSSELSLSIAQDEALKNRTELTALQSGMEAQDFLIKKEKGYLLPNITAGAEFGYQGFGYTFEDDQDYYLISFNLNWSIFQGGRNKAEVRKATLEKEQLDADYQNLTQQIQLEVASAFYELEERLKIYDARLSELKNVEKNFDIIKGKYNTNQVLLVQFNEARNALTTAQISTSIAKYNIAIAKANLQRTIQTSI